MTMMLSKFCVYILLSFLMLYGCYGGDGRGRRSDGEEARTNEAYKMENITNDRLKNISPILDVFPLINLMDWTQHNILKETTWNKEIPTPQQLLKTTTSIKQTTTQLNTKSLERIEQLLKGAKGYGGIAGNLKQSVEESISYINNKTAVQNELPKILDVADECIDKLVIEGQKRGLQSIYIVQILEAIQREIHINVEKLKEIWTNLKERQDAITRLAQYQILFEHRSKMYDMIVCLWENSLGKEKGCPK